MVLVIQFFFNGETEANIIQVAGGLAFILKPALVVKPMNLTILLVCSSLFIIALFLYLFISIESFQFVFLFHSSNPFIFFLILTLLLS